MAPTSPAAPPVTPVVQMRDIRVSFPGVKALDGVNFRLLPGEVHALMGENGAGKSTLIKALTGVHDIESGASRLTANPVASPAHGRPRKPGSAPSIRKSTSAPT